MTILVSGLINIETTLRVDGFPIAYEPVRYPFFGVRSTVSGVGYNVAKALTTLGERVDFLSLIGSDSAGALVRQALDEDRIDSTNVLNVVRETAQSVILYDGEGRRQVNTDLKDIQDVAYPEDRFETALASCSLAALCNINFSRPMLRRAKAAGIPVATDVHAIADLEDDYNRDFMAHADMLFMSHEKLPCAPREWINAVMGRYDAGIVAISMGADGVLLAVRAEGTVTHIPAVNVRPVINTIGAGDALFSAFLHGYHRSGNPVEAMRKAVVFAAYKIGVAGAAEGFLDETRLNVLYAQLTKETS